MRREEEFLMSGDRMYRRISIQSANRRANYTRVQFTFTHTCVAGRLPVLPLCQLQVHLLALQRSRCLVALQSSPDTPCGDVGELQVAVGKCETSQTRMQKAAFRYTITN
jgi:hypothetical protein